MITLTTGGPGTGKTAWMISQLLEIKKTQPYREFFIHGIREFTGFPHTTIYCKSPLCDLCRLQEVPEGAWYVEDYPSWYKSHFFIVVDEVQRIWTKSTGGNSTDAISRLQTHRHYGLDFWLISQSPKLIHTDVKAMVGRHIHLDSKWSGRQQFEWSEVQENTSSRMDAVKRPYSLPKHVFSMYKSAEVHTRQEKRKPLALYALIAMLLMAVALVGYIVVRVKDRVSPLPDVAAAAPVTTGAVVDSSILSKKSDLTTSVDVATPEAIEKSMTPVVVGLPWSAPIYKELVKTKSFPKITGCIRAKDEKQDRCACYSQQGTVIDMPYDVCTLYVQQLPFDRFREDKNQQNDKNVQVASNVEVQKNR